MLAGELTTIADAVTRLAARPTWSPGDAALLADCAALHALEQRVAALKLVALGELDERGLAHDAGATSTMAWLRWRWRMSAGAASAALRLARALRRHPGTRRRLLAGELTQEQAHAIVESLDALPDDLPALLKLSSATSDGPAPGEPRSVDDLAAPGAPDVSNGPGSRDVPSGPDMTHFGPDHADLVNTHPGDADAGDADAADVVARVEALLLDHAASLDPRGLRVAGRHALAVIAPDVADEAERRALERAEARAHRARRLDLHDDAMGGTLIRGYLDREGATILRTALDPFPRRGAQRTTARHANAGPTA
ncbi:DUF222 domain-containing protein [Luedemannella flava]